MCKVQLHADNDGVIIGAIRGKGVVLQGEGVILVSGTPWSQSAVIMGVNIFLLVFLSCACALSGASVRRTKYSLLGSTINSLGVSKPGLCVTAIGIGFKIIINLIIKIVIFIQSLYFPV